MYCDVIHINYNMTSQSKFNIAVSNAIQFEPSLDPLVNLYESTKHDKTNYGSQFVGCVMDPEFCSIAAFYGCLQKLQYLREIDPDTDSPRCDWYKSRICDEAILSNQFIVLKWLRCDYSDMLMYGIKPNTEQCDITDNSLINAIVTDNKELCKYILSNENYKNLTVDTVLMGLKMNKNIELINILAYRYQYDGDTFTVKYMVKIKNNHFYTASVEKINLDYLIFIFKLFLRNANIAKAPVCEIRKYLLNTLCPHITNNLRGIVNTQNKHVVNQLLTFVNRDMLNY